VTLAMDNVKCSLQYAVVLIKCCKRHKSRLEQKWFISVRGESEKNAIEVSRCCGLRAKKADIYSKIATWHTINDKYSNSLLFWSF